MDGLADVACLAKTPGVPCGQRRAKSEWVDRRQEKGYSALLLGCRRRQAWIALGVDRHPLSVPTMALELDHAVQRRPEREVFADAHAVTGVKCAAHLAHQDVSSADLLPSEALDASELRMGIASVPR